MSRASRRSEIRRKIRNKQSEVRICQRVRERVTKEWRKQQDELHTWSDLANHLRREEMTEVVMVKQIFEGQTAQVLQREFLDHMQIKQTKDMAAMELLEQTDWFRCQIQVRIDELEAEIQDLYQDLRDD